MAPIGMARNRYTAKKSVMASVAVFVALAAIPVLADTAQEKVISRLSGQTSTGVGGHTVEGEETRLGTPAVIQMRQELEQGSYQERFIRRISGETSPRAGSKHSEMDKGRQSGTAASTHLHGE